MGLGCVNKREGCLLNNATGYCLSCSWDYDPANTLIMTDGFFATGNCTQVVDSTFVVGGRSVSIDPNCRNYNYTIDDLGIWTRTVPSPGRDALGNPVPAAAGLDSGTYVCFKCKTGFFLNNTNACLPMAISNCADYSPASTALSVKCRTCEDFYFLSGDSLTCAMAAVPADTPIPQCLYYDPTANCIKCNEGYLVGRTGANQFGQTTYCFKSVTEVDPKCQGVNETFFFASLQIACKNCSKISGAFAYPFSLASSPSHACMKLAPQSNCFDYDDITFAQSQKCLLCLAAFYLQPTTLRCLPRSPSRYPDPKCKKFSVAADTCEELFDNSGSAISVTTQLPVLDQALLDSPPARQFSDLAFNYNGWIMGCKVYADSGVCAQCSPPRYLNDQGFDYNNKCLKSGVDLPFCAEYVLTSGGVTCRQCQPGFFFKGGDCLLITAVNCRTYESESQCSSCPSTHPVLQDGNCQLVAENPWCLVYEQSASATRFLCAVCQEGYYPNDDGICQIVKNPIANCRYHLFDGLCQNCTEGYVLQFDGRLCFRKPDWDPNCDEFSYSPDCSLCEPGFFIRDGTCVECQGLTLGCAYCDPADNGVCLLCRFGYSMTDQLTCAVNKDLPPDQLDPLLYRRWFGYPKDPGFDDDDAPQTLVEERTVVAGTVRARVAGWLVLVLGLRGGWR